MKYTAFVPARSGSKRLPHKNIKMLAGKPLAVWTLEALVNSDRIDRVIFSTDSIAYWNLVKEYVVLDKLVLDLRDSEDAGDKVKILDYLKKKNKKIFADQNGNFVLALPTVPLRKTHHINEALDLYETYSKAVFSAVQYNFPISFAFKIINDDWQPIFDESPLKTGNTRSQDQVRSYHPNGAIYIRPIKDLNGGLPSLYTDAIPYIMNEIDSTDIDKEIDFLFAESILKTIFL